jgi:uncharacterized flavoprotein (TIGR03862 family)
MKNQKNIAIIGGGPSGLMAAEVLAGAGHSVTIYDRMPTLGRKFLMAGRGGLNLTHSEPMEKFISRYGEAASWIAPCINAFPPSSLCAWCEGLGQETFVGSSGRVFPRAMKASPLLRAWLKRLESLGVRYAARHIWQGWESDALKFLNQQQETVLVKPDATLLAMGGASWPSLGSDGSWVEILRQNGVEISMLQPANCGFIAHWSEYFSSHFAGRPLKAISLTHKNIVQAGEVMFTAKGIEGGAVYALSSPLRESIISDGEAVLHMDLRPNMSLAALTKKLQARGSQSLSTYLRKAGFSPLAVSLLREVTPSEILAKITPGKLASTLKNLPIKLVATTAIERAISTAGGIKQGALNEYFMLNAKPGVFAAGEMLDWEAPTGGYLLQGCFSTGIAAAKGIMDF